MIFLILYLFCIMIALGLGAIAAYSDFKGLRIPNYTALGVLGSFFLIFAALSFSSAEPFSSLSSHLWAGLAVFAVSFLMYRFKIMGGGDSKLATAYSFWIGLKLMPLFLFYMTLAGALLGLCAIVVRKVKPFKNLKAGTWLARLQEGESAVPYGIPILIGAIFAFFEAGYLSQDVLSAFLVP